MSDRRCPVCDNPVEAPPPDVVCNPHNCPSWEVTHVYDRKTRSWVPEKGVVDVADIEADLAKNRTEVQP